jgi:haloalkane dehalogenase
MNMEENLQSQWRGEYPFDSRYHTLDSGQRMHYLDEGQGEPFLMVHGNPTWSFFYRHWVAHLRANFRCLVPDHLGCGLSDKPQDYSYTLEQHIDNLESLVESVNPEPLNLVVHDWGGAIGLGYAVRHPERIRRLIILNTAAFPFPKIPMRIAACRLPVIGEPAVRGGNLFVRAAMHMTTVKPLSAAARAGFGYPYRSWKDRVAVYNFVRDIPMDPSHLSWTTLNGIAKGLGKLGNKPAKIIWGMRDWCFHEGILKEWPHYLPQAKIHPFDDAGHYLLEDQGPAIYKVVDDWITEAAFQP